MQRALEAGLTPLEIMLNAARHIYNDAMNATVFVKGKKKPYVDRELLMNAAEIASKAAPYVHPRLSAVELIKSLNDADLDAVIAAASAQAGITVNMNGDQQQVVITDGTHQQTVRPALLPIEERGEAINTQ